MTVHQTAGDGPSKDFRDQMGTDAVKWAQEFVNTFRGEVISDNNHNATVDMGLMISWFANALQAGADRESISMMQGRVLVNNISKGWFDEERTPLEGLALITEEVGEGVTALRKWGLDDATHENKYMPGCCAASGVGACDDAPHLPKPEGIGSECADIFIRLLDFCQRYNVNLRAEFERKMAYNATRPYRHGDLKA